ncbi:MAG: hypothetical protein LV480_01370 [Methylacidiphilales bacterium]|nr:hypothetical protein [Candidatus Methylacidiphilales bacterium]
MNKEIEGLRPKWKSSMTDRERFNRPARIIDADEIKHQSQSSGCDSLSHLDDKEELFGVR